MLLTNLLPGCHSVYHLPICIQTLLHGCSHLICPTYSLLHKPQLANNPFSVQFSTCTIPLCAENTERSKCRGAPAYGSRGWTRTWHDVGPASHHLSVCASVPRPPPLSASPPSPSLPPDTKERRAELKGPVNAVS